MPGRALISRSGQYLMAFYLFLSERHGSGVGSRWAFMGLAVKLGVSVSNCPSMTHACVVANGNTARIRWDFVSIGRFIPIFSRPVTNLFPRPRCGTVEGGPGRDSEAPREFLGALLV